MCGIAGYLRTGPAHPTAGEPLALLATIRERGPDGEGVCLVDRTDDRVVRYRTDLTPPTFRHEPHVADESALIRHDLAIAHARYAIMDRSSGSHQPMVAEESGTVLVFQGEIYNYLELRAELTSSGHRFATAGDVEVLLAAWAAWGDATWERLNGFWSVAIYDAPTRRLVLSRDRCGIAPMYLLHTGDTLFFGSSPIGLARLGHGRPRPDVERVRSFVRSGSRDVDRATLFQGVESLPPGTTRSFELGASSPLTGVDRSFWSLPDRTLSPADLSLDEAADTLRDTLTSAVELRLRGERSVAFQLSGGLDSTSVIALAAEVHSGPLATYTVSVPEENEEPYARTMAARFSLDRTILDDLDGTLLSDPVATADLFAEPVQAPSALAHHEMCRRMKRDGFGVTLSGSGGDEALAGYEWDFWPTAKHAIRAHGDRLSTLLYQLVLEFGSTQRAAASVRRRFTPSDRSEGGQSVRSDAGADPTQRYLLRRRHHFRVAHLPYYLASNDRATLGIPLEHRQPFLDHRVVELGVQMPPTYLFRRGWTKYVLRRAMASLLPPEILWRRDKMGFPFPVGRLVAAHRPAMVHGWTRYRTSDGVDGGTVDFATEYEADPRRLWRACSVGFWLDALDA